MARSVALVLFAIAAHQVSGALLHERNAAPKLTSFEMSCYYEADPAGESGGAKGKSYRGLVTSTTSGRTCQKWTADHPHKDTESLSVTPDEEGGEGLMKWGTGIGNHNYCRNPDQSMPGPWCYTMDPAEDHAKEACDIPVCPKKKRDFPDEAKTLTKEIDARDCQC